MKYLIVLIVFVLSALLAVVGCGEPPARSSNVPSSIGKFKDGNVQYFHSLSVCNGKRYYG